MDKTKSNPELDLRTLKEKCLDLCQSPNRGYTVTLKREDEIIEFLNNAPEEARDILVNNVVIKKASIMLLGRLPKDVHLKTPEKTINCIINFAAENFVPNHLIDLCKMFPETAFVPGVSILHRANHWENTKAVIACEHMINTGGFAEFLKNSIETLKNELSVKKENMKDIFEAISILLPTQNEETVDRVILDFCESTLKNPDDFEYLGELPSGLLKTKITRHALKACLDDKNIGSQKPKRPLPRIL